MQAQVNKIKTMTNLRVFKWLIQPPVLLLASNF